VDTPREQRLVDAAVVLADTVSGEFDLSEVLYGLTASCVELLEVDTAGLLLADEDGRLHTVASSHEGTRLLELFPTPDRRRAVRGLLPHRRAGRLRRRARCRRTMADVHSASPR
jgi:hypothetical protein